jgi:hypothetical protein
VARAPFSLEDGRIRIADAVFVYLERGYAPAGVLEGDAVPRSHGVAPAAVSEDGEVLAAVGAGEAVWLGFQATDRARPVTLRVRVDGSPPLDALTGERWEPAAPGLLCPPRCRLGGVAVKGGRRPFGAVGEERLAVVAWVPEPAEVPVRLVRPDRFAELTGREPDAIDPDAAYRGWRLP